MIECIIICAGEATRWNNYLGVPKHLINVDGETLIERTVRLLHKYKCEDINVHIVVKDFVDDRYRVDGAKRFKAILNPDNVDADKFLSSKCLWNKTGRTIVIYGDVWFTDESIKRIIRFKETDWTLFANFDECFAQSFYPIDITKHLNALFSIRDSYKRGDISRCGGWEHYRAFCDTDLVEHKVGPHFYLVFDKSDDFDFPEDYDLWIKRHEEYRK